MTKIKFKKLKLSRKADIKNKMKFTKLRVGFFIDEVFENKNFTNLAKSLSVAIPVLFVSIISYDFYNNKNDLNYFKNNNIKTVSVANETKAYKTETGIIDLENIDNDKISLKTDNEKVVEKESKKDKIKIKAQNKILIKKEENPAVNNVKKDSKIKKSEKNSEKKIAKITKKDNNLQKNNIKVQKRENAFSSQKVEQKSNNSVKFKKNEYKKTVAQNTVITPKKQINEPRKPIESKNILARSGAKDNGGQKKIASTSQVSVVSSNDLSAKKIKTLEKNKNSKILALESISEMRVLGGYYNKIDQELEKTKNNLKK